MSVVNRYLSYHITPEAIGWAVTTKDYHLARSKGRDLWGVRTFAKAEMAKDRRMARASRNVHKKKVARIGLMTSYFADELNKVDPNFLLRLQNSNYYSEDKDEPVRGTHYIFFDDHDYTDKDYYANFPTISHLKKALVEGGKKYDIRLLYLAILNYFHHRGNFLNESISADGDTADISTTYQTLQTQLEEFEIVLPTIDGNELIEILANRTISRSDKAMVLLGKLGLHKGFKREAALVKGLCGLDIVLQRLFPDVIDDNKLRISFNSSTYDEDMSELATQIPESVTAVLETMKGIYDAGVLHSILGENKYLCDARVRSYEKHHDDLMMLKDIYNSYLPKEAYRTMFNSDEPGTYSAYIGSRLDKKGNRIRRGAEKGRSREDLYKHIKEDLAKLDPTEPFVQQVLQEIEVETFLPLQMTSENHVLPNSLLARELSKILENAEAYYPFLKETDETGLSVSEKIKALFSYHLPYYIGPVSGESKNGWAVRKEEGRVLPWNYTEKIDVKATAEEFIRRMVNRCQYMNNEMVLPRHSLMYEAYCVLNEINPMTIKGEPISITLKQQIFEDLYKKGGKKVTRKKLVAYLKKSGHLNDDAELGGIDLELKNALTSYGKMKAVLGDLIDTPEGEEMAEQIIFWSTIYGDKKFVKEQIIENYPSLTKEQVERLSGYKFQEWGSYSRKFFELKGEDTVNHVSLTIMDTLMERNMNLMQIVWSPDYTFKKELDELDNQAYQTISEFTYEDLDEFKFTAPVKRMMWQTIKLTKEICTLIGGEPEKIFVDMIRPDDERDAINRKQTRKELFLYLYKNIKDKSRDWKKVIEEADANGTLRSKKMYLWLTQMGKDMYTGTDIPLEDLFDDTKYDIDHIYPKHFARDESLHTNMVLVSRSKNKEREDTYPLPEEIRKNPSLIAFWNRLVSDHLITSEKCRRLMSSQEFSDNQLAGFIAAEMLVTNVASRASAGLLKKLMPNSKVAYTKSANVAAFRQEFDFPAVCPALNDLHYAKTAYLNAVVGNVYLVKFTDSPIWYIKNEYRKEPKKYHYNINRMFAWNVIRDDDVAWVAARQDGGKGTIATIREVMSKNSILTTRMNPVESGKLTNDTVVSKSKAKPGLYMPLKTSDPRLADVTKYGGRTSIASAYYCLVEHTVKGKRVRTLEPVPIYLREKLEKNDAALKEYCENDLGLIAPSVRVKKIPLQSYLKLDGYYYYIGGRSNIAIGLRNATPLLLNDEWQKYIRKLDWEGNEDVTAKKNLMLYDHLSRKLSSGIFTKRSNSPLTIMTDGRDKFAELEVEKQKTVLKAIIKACSMGMTGADLSLIGGGANSCLMRMNKQISGHKECMLIHQSVTGVFEKKIDLLTV